MCAQDRIERRTAMSESSGRKWVKGVAIAGAAAVVVTKGPKLAGYVARKARLPQLFNRATEAIDHMIRWDKLPTTLGLVELIGIRNTLREKNLYDTSSPSIASQPASSPTDARYLTARTVD